MKTLFVIKLVVLISALLWKSCAGNLYCDIYEDELPSSCKDILAKYPGTPSGNYDIQPVSYGPTITVYCDMENKRCGSKGWTAIARVDMSLPGSQCPGNLHLITDSESGIRSCGADPNSIGCAFAEFLTHGIEYTEVCGMLRGYQVGSPDAFGPYVNDQGNPESFVDGVIISHGTTPDFIWIYANGAEKVPSSSSNIVCPCTGPLYNGVVPPYVGTDYYCDSGVVSDPQGGVFYPTPLWTGTGCNPPDFCCSASGLPWFSKKLPLPTTDYITLEVCHNELPENTPLDQIQLYIR